MQVNNILQRFQTLKMEDALAYSEEKNLAGLPVKRIAFLRSVTLEPMEPFLKALGSLLGLRFEFYYSGFNQYFQEINDPKSGFYKFQPDAVIFFIRLEDILSRQAKEGKLEKPAFEAELLNCEKLITEMTDAVRKRTFAYILFSNFSSFAGSRDGIYESQDTLSLVNLCRRLNLEVPQILQGKESTAVFDFDYFINCEGKKSVFDLRNWVLSANPFGADSFAPLVKYLGRYLQAIFGRTKKCIVVDLDNTLWGGVYAEEGMEGIKLGEDYPGVIYKEFQKRLIDYKNRGFILAINSKNNSEDALQVLEKHPSMALKKEDFAVMKINWLDKAQNCRSIARELNIGLDSLVFIDDDPVERGLVASLCPEVYVPEFPGNIIELPQLLDEIILLDNLKISREDRLKSDMYRIQGERKEFESKFKSVDEFLKDLDMRAVISKVDVNTLSRAAQLSLKSNQFNLTTRRYSQAELAAKLNDPCWHLYNLKLEDRFGDNGIVGLAVVKEDTHERTWFLDEFLLSCRVMSRGVEQAFLDFIRRKARDSNIKHILGQFIPSAKNKPVEKFYQDSGFSLVDEEKIIYSFDVGLGTVFRHFCRIEEKVYARQR